MSPANTTSTSPTEGSLSKVQLQKMTGVQKYWHIIETMFERFCVVLNKSKFSIDLVSFITFLFHKGQEYTI